MNRSYPLILIAGIIFGLSLGLMLSPIISNEKGVTIALWLDVVHRVCTSIGGLGTFVAIIFVVRQFNLLHTQSELVQRNTMATLDGQLYARLDSFNKVIVEHDAEYELLNNPYQEIGPTVHRYKLHHLCDLGFTLFEEIYKHHIRYQLLDSEDWDEWQQNMAHFFSKPYVRGYWATTASRYAKTFQAFATDLVAQTEPQSKPDSLP
ncbi:MAG: hypothetical protein JWM11_3146 [Planctomycetaceae bacterium]|nr:hypothetical protein [Planctomycetaceae bacterium]